MHYQRIPESERSPALAFYYQNLEVNRAKARERAKARYYANKEAKLLKNAEYRRNNPSKWKAIKAVSSKKYNKRRFFFVRACSVVLRLKDGKEAEALCSVLSRAWYNQRGRCAYTGKKLGRDAQVDHKIPLSRGGTNDASNLHWVTADANQVKRTMTHDEFIAICSDIAAYIEANKPRK
jgi:5-methylcytosine-specific restriction endonuclease McrA